MRLTCKIKILIDIFNPICTNIFFKQKLIKADAKNPHLEEGIAQDSTNKRPGGNK
jgi:hypothetical protein